MIGTYRPRICGIATFTADLVDSMRGCWPDASVQVAALKVPAEAFSYPSEVTSEIRQECVTDYLDAADVFNRSGLEAVSLQHEFGIFGGHDGELVLDLMEHLDAPIVTTLHTVLHNPTVHQREVLRKVAALSARVVVMSQTARRFLIELYGVKPDVVSVIPHGVPEQRFADSAEAKARLGLTGRRVILTFGLLSPSKGIEDMIRALPAIVREHPNVTYIVLGAAHPLAVTETGEPYIEGLKRLVARSGMEAHTTFETRFVGMEELCLYLGAADVYVTPYVNEDQITSGTLSYALGCGIATVSTPYWHAREMLAEGRGRLVPFRDPAALGCEVGGLLSDDEARDDMRQKAYEYSRGAVWQAVGKRYLDLLDSMAPTPGVVAGESSKALDVSVA